MVKQESRLCQSHLVIEPRYEQLCFVIRRCGGPKLTLRHYAERLAAGYSHSRACARRVGFRRCKGPELTLRHYAGSASAQTQ